MCILYTEVLQPIGANIKKPGSGVAETGPSLRERVSPFSCEFLQNVHLAARKRNETKNAKEKAKMHCSFHKICQSPEKHTKIYQEKEKKQPCPLVDGCILSSVFPMVWLHCNPNSCSVKVMQSSGWIYTWIKAIWDDIIYTESYIIHYNSPFLLVLSHLFLLKLHSPWFVFDWPTLHQLNSGQKWDAQLMDDDKPPIHTGTPKQKSSTYRGVWQPLLSWFTSLFPSHIFLI